MTQLLAHRTIAIVEGRSISTFRLCKALEDEGAAVCVTSPREAAGAVRRTKPDAVVIDFSLAVDCEDFVADLEFGEVVHMYSSSPNRQQEIVAQVLAAQDVVVALAELVNQPARNVRGYGLARDIDPTLYAI